MIRTTIKTNFPSVIDDIVDFIDVFPDIAFKIGKESFEIIREPLLDTLRIYPPELPNQKYIRTFKLRRGWKAGIQRIDHNRFAIVVSNDVEYTSFVVGSLSEALALAVSFQADIHRGRWELATLTVQHQFDDFLRIYEGKMGKLLDFGTSRRIR